MPQTRGAAAQRDQEIPICPTIIVVQLLNAADGIRHLFNHNKFVTTEETDFKVFTRFWLRHPGGIYDAEIDLSDVFKREGKMYTRNDIHVSIFRRANDCERITDEPEKWDYVTADLRVYKW